MGEGEGEDFPRTLLGLHLGDEGFHRLHRGVPHVDHAQPAIGHDRADIAAGGGEGQGEKLLGARHHVDMRVFLAGHDEVGVGPQPIIEVAMQVEFDTDDGVGATKARARATRSLSQSSWP